MSLGFILGRAGSGKTTHCLRSVLESLASGPDGPPLVLLVPEQATLGMEQALLETVPAPAVGRVRVSGFRRLARGVLEETAGPVRPVTRLGCLMALRGILERRRSDLTILAPVAGQTGAAARVEAALAELRAWGVGARELADLASALGDQGPSRLGRKLRDLALLAHELERWLAGRLLEPEGVLGEARRRLPASDLRGASVWVDGFSDFTRPELEFLLELAAVARVRVALCLDPAVAAGGEGVSPGPFAEVAATHRELSGRAARLGLVLEETVALGAEPPPRFSSRPELARLEAFAAGRAGVAVSGPGGGEPAAAGTGASEPAVRVVAAPDRRAEVEWAAREILRLVREGGLRFREVGVLLRDVGPYADLVESVFPFHGIPFFLDRRRPAADHPLARLVLSALEAVGGWSREAVLAFLKNDLQPASVDAVDRIEDAARRRWLGGDGAQKAWLAAWPDLPPALERMRRRLLAPLARLGRRVGRRGRPPAARVGLAVWRLLEELRLPARLGGRAERAAGEGRTGEAADHLQAWEGVVGVLEEYVEHLGDTRLALAEHVRVLQAALAGLDLATPPPALDQVVVGAVDRSRFHGLAALLVLGAVEGEFPAVPQEDAVLDDGDRQRLAEVGRAVGPTTRELERREEYLAYVALTRAARRLWLSWPLVDGEGRRLEPSPLVRRVQESLPDLVPAPEVLSREPPPEECAGGADVLDALLAAVGEAAQGFPPSPAWPALYEVARLRPPLAARLVAAVADVGPGGAPWPATPVPARGPLTVSVTELEDMAACPFRRFLAHVVRARPRREARLDGRLLGELYHAALAALGRAALGRPGGFADLTGEETRSLVDEVVREALVGEGGALAGLPPAVRGMAAERARRSLSSAGEALRSWAGRSAFRLAAVEMDVRLPLPVEDHGAPPAGSGAGPARGEVLVTGRVDRLDEAFLAGERLLLVVDYKRRAAAPGGREAVREGLHLQLPLYCLAAAACVPGPAPVAAGALLFPVEPSPAAGDGGAGRNPHRARGWHLGERPVVEALDGAAGREESVLGVRWRRDGQPAAADHLLDRGQFSALLADALAAAQHLARHMAAGEVRRRPWRRGSRSACDTCEYAAVCPFDPLLGDEHRPLGREAPAEGAVADDGNGPPPEAVC